MAENLPDKSLPGMAAATEDAGATLSLFDKYEVISACLLLVHANEYTLDATPLSAAGSFQTHRVGFRLIPTMYQGVYRPHVAEISRRFERIKTARAPLGKLAIDETRTMLELKEGQVVGSQRIWTQKRDNIGLVPGKHFKERELNGDELIETVDRFAATVLALTGEVSPEALRDAHYSLEAAQAQTQQKIAVLGKPLPPGKLGYT